MNQSIETEKPQFSDSQPNCAENESVLEVLFESYSEVCSFNNETIRSGFQELNALIGGMPIRETDQVVDSVCDLCREYGRVGFIEGIKAGVRLKEELE